jgi:predicted nucleic acid-binding protein
VLEPACIDASCLVAMVRGEPVADRLDSLWLSWAAEGRRLVAPTVLMFEIAGVLERKMRSGETDLTMARMALVRAESLAAKIEQPEIVGGMQTAWDLALKYHLRVLDACYLAVARQENAVLWTLDRELARRASGNVP